MAHTNLRTLLLIGAVMAATILGFALAISSEQVPSDRSKDGALRSSEIALTDGLRR